MGDPTQMMRPGMGMGPGMGQGRGGFQGFVGGGGMPQIGPGGGTILNQMLGDDDDEESTPLIVEAVVEVRKEDIKPSPTGRINIKHKWGKTTLYVDNGTKEIQIQRIQLDTVAQQFKLRRSRIKEADPDRADKLLDLAKWALGHGLLNEVPKIMQELAVVNPKLPEVASFQKTQAALDKNVARDDVGIRWRDKLGNFKDERSKHYVLCYDVTSVEQAKNRIKCLEDNMRGFYYWFALRNRVLPVPDRRLVAFLVANKETFEGQHKDIFDDDPLVVDGFYDRRDNIAVFSPHRLDQGFDALLKIVGPLWKQFDGGYALLHGQVKKGIGIAHDNEIARAETLTLLTKAMQEESEIVSVSFEGTRQLLATLGHLPRGVEVPRWFDFGLATFFQIPKGAFWNGTGEQNQTYLSQFKVWDEDKKLEKGNAPNILRAVVADRFFRRIPDAKNKENNARTRPAPLPGPWSITLPRSRPMALIKYCQEWPWLPLRDLELNDDVLLLAFARAFDLVDPSHPDQIDSSKWNILANDWIKFLQDTGLEVQDVITELAQDEKDYAPCPP